MRPLLSYLMPSERGLAQLKKLFVAIILLAITLSVVVAFAASGNPAPAELKITTSDGEEVTLSSLLSQHDYVILNIFQPGNTASSMELPWFESIHASLPGSIKVVAVTPESASDLSSYKTSFGLSFPIGFSADLTAFLAGKGVDIKDYPTTLVFNKLFTCKHLPTYFLQISFFTRCLCKALGRGGGKLMFLFLSIINTYTTW